MSDEFGSAVIEPSAVDDFEHRVLTELLTLDELFKKAMIQIGQDAAVQLIEFAIEQKPPTDTATVLRFLQAQKDMTSRTLLGALQGTHHD